MYKICYVCLDKISPNKRKEQLSTLSMRKVDLGFFPPGQYKKLICKIHSLLLLIELEAGLGGSQVQSRDQF